MKKIRILLLTAVFLCAALLSVSIGYIVSAAEAYGDDAYAYMQYLQSTYPNRAVAYPNLDAAAAWLKQEVAGMGYQYAEQPFSIDLGNGVIINGENIIFSKSGASDRVILVGAHYDSVLTNGTDDNATGTGLLLETAKRLASDSTLPYTVRFVLFSAEEPGCYGSQYYVDNLSTEERARIACMYNMDTIGAGDNMYLYGGGLDDAGTPIRTWAVEQTLQAAQNLGLAMSYHPDVNPAYPVPVKNTASDHQGFDRAGIPYVYFEASNWNGGPYTNFYQTSNPAVPDGKMMHVQAFENLDFYTQTFGTRVYDHMKAYSTLLDYMLHHLEEGVSGSYTYEERDETVWAVSDVMIRAGASTSAEALDVLHAGASIRLTGYQADWCRVDYPGMTAYVKTEYLTSEAPEASTEETAETESVSVEVSEEPTVKETMTEPETDIEESTAETDGTKETAGQETTSAQESEAAVVSVPSFDREENGGSGNFFQSFSPETFVSWIQGSSSAQIGIIAGIILVAVFLCVLIFLIQHSGGKKKK